MARLQKLAVVVGATGTGKSDLAIRVAQAFNGEVINADAIQLYRGLDIPVNKVSAEERSLVPHHLLDMLELSEAWTVLEFQKAATHAIADIASRGKLPVLCGGTNYYVQSVLWESTMGGRDLPPAEEVAAAAEQADGAHNAAEDDGALHRKLQEVDPAMADQLHPANVRKIQRSLEIYHATGKKHSDMILEQKQAAESATPRYDACLLWCDAPKDVLVERLNQRVDKMVARGMMDEISQFRQQLLASGHEMRYGYGVLQAIGFKEFEPYLAANCADQTTELLAQCVAAVQISTRQYAKRQVQWLHNKTLKMRPPLPVFRYECIEVKDFEESVVTPALEVVQALLEGKPLPEAGRVANSVANDDVHRKYVCEPCGRTLRGKSEWTAHLASRQHRKHTKRCNNRLRPNDSASDRVRVQVDAEEVVSNKNN